MSGHHVPLAPDPRARHAARRHEVARDASRGDGPRLLLALVGAPLAWVVHLAASYITIALWCANGWEGGAVALLVLTILGALACAATGVLAWRLWREGQERIARDGEPGLPESWDARLGERSARISFLALLALFMAAMFGYLIVLEGLPSLFAPLCHTSTVP